MTIKLSKEAQQDALAAIKRYFTENMEEEIGDLKATLFLEFCLKQLGPPIYNRAIADAQKYMHEQVGDLDGSCHEPEVGYWDAD